MYRQLSKPQIIAISACHTCCARIGEPCTFARCDDPHNHRAASSQSHLDRIQRARKKHKEALDSIALAL